MSDNVSGGDSGTARRHQRSGSERIATAIGLFLGVVGAVPVFVSVETTGAKILVLLVCATLVATFLRGAQLWAAGRLDPIFGVLAAISAALLVVSLIFSNTGKDSGGQSPAEQGSSSPQCCPLATLSPTQGAFPSGVRESVAIGPAQIRLDEIEPAEGWANHESATVDTQTFDHTLSRWIGDSAICGTQRAAPTVSYNLNRQYAKLTATAGLSNEATAEATGTVEIRADNKVLAIKNLTLGRSMPIEVALVGALRLEIRLISHYCQPEALGKIVIGDPIVTR